MLKLHSFVLFISCMCWFSTGHAQSNSDTIRLKPADIIADRVSSYITGTDICIIDSGVLNRYQDENLSSLLKHNSSLSVKDYGPGGIATVSCRGTAATQTGILWNGFLINSPNLALCDLSLVPAGIADEAVIHYGGSSAVNGNAALGGLVALNYKPGFYDHTRLGLSAGYGNAGNYSAGFSYMTGNPVTDNRTQVFYTSNSNNFLFRNTAKKGFPAEIENHAKVINYGFMQQSGFKIGRNREIDAGAWYQVTNREQPPLMTSDQSKAVLNDSIFRIYLSGHLLRAGAAYYIRTAYFDETERYDDDHSSVHESYHVRSYKGDVSGKFFLMPHLDADMGSSINYFAADITEYRNSIADHRISVYGGLNYQPVPALKIRMNLLQEYAVGSHPPCVPSAGMEYTIMKNKVVLKTSAGKNYNLPSLNDKYWQPGGNPYLKPEQAWSADAGIVLIPDKNRNLKISVTVYDMFISNWIQWYPSDSTGIYRSTNLKNVHADGMEASLNYLFRLKKISFTLKGSVAYTRSVNESLEINNGEPLEGRQLMYVPFYNGNAEAGMHVDGFMLSWQYSFTGLRYIQSDDKQALPAYQVSGIYAEKHFVYDGWSFDLYLKINNLWNEAYQEVPWHAMPLRTLTTGFRLHLDPVKKNIQTH